MTVLAVEPLPMVSKPRSYLVKNGVRIIPLEKGIAESEWTQQEQRGFPGIWWPGGV